MGDSISEGKVMEFTKKPGDFVEIDEVVAIIETDKTSLEIRSPEKGVLEKFFQPIDANVQVDSPLFQLDTSKTSQESSSSSSKKVSSEEIKESTPKTEIKTGENETKGSSPKGTEKEKEKPDPVKVKPSPKTETKTQFRPDDLKLSGDRSETRVPLSRMRLKIAQRLKESQNTAASLTTFNRIDCSAILDLKNKYAEKFLKMTDSKLGLMSSFVKASSLSLQKFPSINAYLDLEGQSIVEHNYIDISVAVAGPRGLVVPVLRNVEKMNFATVEKEIKRFAKMAREGTLKVENMKGGTFTISNSGVYRSLIGTPIINPPQSSVLGMYGIFDTPVAEKGEVKIRPVMQVALTYDHRMVDGREAILFLQSVKEYIEDPVTMLFY